MRLIVAVPMLLLFLWAQRYWFLRLWRFANRIESRVPRRIVHGLTVFGFGLVAAALLALFFSGRRDLVWRFSTNALGPRLDADFMSTPLCVNGRLYTTAGFRRDVVCLDAGTGELLWMHTHDEGQRIGSRGGAGVVTEQGQRP